MKKSTEFNKLIIAIASSALFDLSDSDKVFKDNGEAAYRKFQSRHVDKILGEGIAFIFIKKLLRLNSVFKKEVPGGVVEVVLLSRNSHETGLRVFKSIQHYKLDIQKAGFFSGESPHRYIKAFNASLFLSANFKDVKAVIDEGHPAGMVLKDEIEKTNSDEDKELRIAFDFDGILADDGSESVYRKRGLKKYKKSEIKKSNLPLSPGPLHDFAKKIAELRKLESLKLEKDKRYKRAIKIILITARSAPVHERAIHTLGSWGIDIDQSFFLGTTKKKNILETLNPHIYFDDQKKNIDGVKNVASVFVPFGAMNK